MIALSSISRALRNRWIAALFLVGQSSLADGLTTGQVVIFSELDPPSKSPKHELARVVSPQTPSGVAIVTLTSGRKLMVLAPDKQLVPLRKVGPNGQENQEILEVRLVGNELEFGVVPIYGWFQTKVTGTLASWRVLLSKPEPGIPMQYGVPEQQTIYPIKLSDTLVGKTVVLTPGARKRLALKPTDPYVGTVAKTAEGNWAQVEVAGTMVWLCSRDFDVGRRRLRKADWEIEVTKSRTEPIWSDVPDSDVPFSDEIDRVRVVAESDYNAWVQFVDEKGNGSGDVLWFPVDRFLRDTKDEKFAHGLSEGDVVHVSVQSGETQVLYAHQDWVAVNLRTSGHHFRKLSQDTIREFLRPSPAKGGFEKGEVVVFTGPTPSHFKIEGLFENGSGARFYRGSLIAVPGSKLVTAEEDPELFFVSVQAVAKAAEVLNYGSLSVSVETVFYELPRESHSQAVDLSEMAVEQKFRVVAVLQNGKIVYERFDGGNFSDGSKYSVRDLNDDSLLFIPCGVALLAHSADEHEL